MTVWKGQFLKDGVWTVVGFFFVITKGDIKFELESHVYPIATIRPHTGIGCFFFFRYIYFSLFPDAFRYTDTPFFDHLNSGLKYSSG